MAGLGCRPGRCRENRYGGGGGGDRRLSGACYVRAVLIAAFWEFNCVFNVYTKTNLISNWHHSNVSVHPSDAFRKYV